MAKRLAELGALQDAVSNDESSPKRLALAGYIRGLFLDWSANPYNPLSRLTARGRLLGYFWDSGAIGLSMNFADQNYLVKDGTVQSKSFSQIVNFSRTTNATVTNSAGQITYAPHNLLTYSEQFDNAAWLKVGTATSTSNTTIAPDGTQTADTVTNATDVSWSVGNGIQRQITSLISSTAYAFSLYIRGIAGTTAKIAIRDQSTGLVTESAALTLTSEWQRVSISRTTGASTTALGLIIGATDGTVAIWGAQLEIGSTATTYNSTTVKNLLGYSELFDNAAWTKSNSFVQTNLLTYSEAFDNAAWTKAYSTVTADTTLAPNGYQTADTLFETAITQYHIAYRAVTVTNGISYTFSVNLKPVGRNWARLTLQGTTEIGAYFDLANGVLGTVDAGVTATITPAANGFYRCSISRVTDNVSTYTNIYVTTANNTTVYAGDITKGIYLWGAQLVQGSVAGDYRRTDAAALPVYYPNHNGVVCAEQLHGTAANGTILESYTASGAPMTFSLWMRRITGTGNVDITMDTGATWTTQAITSSWARYSITSTPASGARTAGVRLVTSGDVIQVFGAQLSDSASLDPYVLNAAAAPTAAAYYGARFDYDPVTLAPKGLLIEEQRANLVLQSGFAGAVAGTPGTAPTSWTLAVSGGTTNALVSDGLGGNIISFTTVAARQFLTQSVSVSANTTYTASVYINSNTGSVYSSIFAIAALPAGATVTYYANGALVNVASYVPLAGDRLTAIVVISATAGTVTPRIGIGAGGNDTGTVSFSKIQLEAGAFATSYIPTAASQVTRAADVATIQGSNFYSWYNQNEGSVVINADETSTAVSGNRKTLYTFTAGNFNNIIRNGIDSGTVASFTATYESSAQASLSISASYQANVFSKSSTAYKVNDFYLNVNNGTATVDTSGTTPMSFFMDIGYGPQVSSGTGNTAGDFLNGHIKQISYYPQRLSNDVLKGLTA